MPEPGLRRIAVLVVVLTTLVGCRPQSGASGPTPAPAREGPTAAITTSKSPSPPSTSFEPEPVEPAAYDEWLTAIPDRNRRGLDVALPEDGGDFTRRTSGVRFELCDEEAFVSGRVRDRVAVSAFGPEYAEVRDLRVFPDDRAAHRLLRRIARVVSGCPGPGTGEATWHNELRASRLGGDASFTAVQSHFTWNGLPVLGATFWEVVRIGNAVLLTATSGEYDPTTTLDRGIRIHVRDVAPVVEEMCVFAADPCAG